MPPTVTLTSPSVNASYSAPGVVLLKANPADSDGVVTKVVFFQGATEVGTSIMAPYTFNWSNVPIGDYSITVKAYDEKGGMTTSAAVPISVKANVAPTVSLTTSATSVDLVGPDAVIPLSAVAADSDGSISLVSFYNGASQLGYDTTAPYNFTWSYVAPGTYTITAKATDDKGVVTTSAPISVTVKANVAPTISIVSPVSPATFYGPGTLTLAANAADSDGSDCQSGVLQRRDSDRYHDAGPVLVRMGQSGTRQLFHYRQSDRQQGGGSDLDGASAHREGSTGSDR
ncbi:Ig-like domain-containing protein [Massilia sp. H-1]|nr:Ig-like domain-containing protein [Massilia sp. H-1]